MRILYIDLESRLLGAELSLLDLIDALDRERYQPEVLLGQPGPLVDALEAREVKVHQLELPRDLLRIPRNLGPGAVQKWFGSLKALPALASIRRAIKQAAPDLLHTNNMKAHVLGGLAGRLAGVRQVMHVRDILGPGPFRTLLRYIAKHWAVRTITISEAVRQEMFDGIEAVQVIHNGVQLEAFAGPRQTGPTPLIGMIGQIARWKGQAIFIEAAAKLHAQQPETRFEIIGKVAFAENEAAYFEELQQQVARLGLTEVLTFVGQVSPIAPKLKTLDLLVHASIEPEPFGRVIVEAMAAGTPVIASDCGAPAEIIEHERTGLLVPPADPTALAEAMVRMLDSPIEASEAAGRFRIEHTAEAVMALYQALPL